MDKEQLVAYLNKQIADGKMTYAQAVAEMDAADKFQAKSDKSAYTKEQFNKDYESAQSLKNDPTAYSGALKSIHNKMIGAGKATFDLNDTTLLLNEWGKYDPEQVKVAQQQVAQQAASAKAGQLNQGLDILFQGIQAGIGANQISKAKNAASQLQRPSLPGVAASNPQLAQALNDAKLGTINAGDVLRPAQAGIQDAYRAAVNQAQVASGGQAGAYQGMANLANLQRMRAQLGLAPIAQEAKLQNQQIYNQLLGQKLDETQSQFQNRFANAQVAFDQYDKDAQAVGGLGSIGRTNMLNAGRQLTQSLQGLTPYITQPTTPYPVQPTPDVGAYARQVRPMLKATLPNSPFKDTAANDFYNNAMTENLYRRQGYGTPEIESMTTAPNLRLKDPNYDYGY